VAQDFFYSVGAVISRKVYEAVLDRAVKQGLRGTHGYVSEFALLVKEKASDKRDVLDANKRLAEEGRKAAVEQFRSRRSNVPSYRKGDRLTGRLLKIIDSPSFVRATKSGIEIGDFQRLNAQAAHWARINYGTVGHETPKPDKVVFLLDDAQIAYFKPAAKPRPQFKVPGRGVGYINPKGQLFLRRPDAEYDRAEQAFVRGALNKKPVEPFYFVEAAVKGVAVEFGAEYTQLIFKWLQDSGREAANFNPITNARGAKVL
jgi:hypothetical protein